MNSTNNTKLPQRPLEHIIGDQGITILRQSIPPHWIFRELNGDYGIDCEIEITNEDGSLTGAIVKVQVKTTSVIKNIKIRTETIRYWLLLPVPVILVRVSLSPIKILWIDVREFLSAEGRVDTIYQTKLKTITFNFNNAASLPESHNSLRSLSEMYQEYVHFNREESESEAGGFFMAMVFILLLHEGSPVKMLKWFREHGTDEQIANDFSLVYWIKKQVDNDPEFINRFKKTFKNDLPKDIFKDENT